MTIPSDTLPTLPFLHQDMPDRPNTIFPSTLAFKQALDSSTVALQTVHNALIADLLASGAGVSASEFIGSATISGVLGATVYAQLTDLKAQIQALVGGVIPPSSVTNAMLQTDSVDTRVLAPNAVTNTEILAGSVQITALQDYLQTALVGAGLYTYRNVKGGF